MQSDARLVELAGAGSEPAYEVIVLRYRRALVRHCARLVGPDDAEEVVQEALLGAHAALVGGSPVRELSPWLHAIARNAALSCLRARCSRPVRLEADPDRPSAALDQSLQHREEAREVLAAVRSLPHRQREAIVMRELEGRSYDEIAVRLETSHGAVRQLLSRARSSVRRRVGALLPIEPLVRSLGAGAGGAAEVGGVAGCTLGAKACVAALVPAAIAVIAAAPAPRLRPVAGQPRHRAPVAAVRRPVAAVAPSRVVAAVAPRRVEAAVAPRRVVAAVAPRWVEAAARRVEPPGARSRFASAPPSAAASGAPSGSASGAGRSTPAGSGPAPVGGVAPPAPSSLSAGPSNSAGVAGSSGLAQPAAAAAANPRGPGVAAATVAPPTES
jgi:RNA polymerase sigma factor (sigma-70 family)